MRILVLEHLSLSPSDSEEAALAAEGYAMLRAVAGDLSREAGVEATAAVQARLAGSFDRSFRTLDVNGLSHDEIAGIAASFDGVLLIAPEIDGIAVRWAETLERAGAVLLSPPSSFIAWASDKLTVAKSLPSISPPTALLSDGPPPDAWGRRLVVKPRDGVGGMFTILVERGSLHLAAAVVRRRGFRGELIVQPYREGRAISVAAVGRGVDPPIVLPPASQTVEFVVDQEIPSIAWAHYRGGELPVRGIEHRLKPLFDSLIAFLGPVSGWYGVDVVLADDGRDVVVDVNPRLTTSYLGCSAAFPGIPARLLLGRETKSDLLALREEGRGPVAFDTTGRVDFVNQSSQRM